MTTPILDLADAVTSALNALSATDSLGFTAVRSYLPVLNLPDAATLTVNVIPAEEDSTPAARDRTQDDRQVFISLLQKLTTGDNDTFSNSQIDSLLAVVEAIKESLKFSQPGGYAWIKTAHKPLYDPEHMEQYRQFTTLLTVTFRSVQ